MSCFKSVHGRINPSLQLRHHLFTPRSTNPLQFHSIPSPSLRSRSSPAGIDDGNGRSGFPANEAKKSNASARSRDGEGRNGDIAAKGRGKLRREEAVARRELSPDMEVFVRHLYRDGYFRYANLLPGNRLVLSCFEFRYGRDFIKSAAERFGRDNQEIAKWLSGSDLKEVASFGCPSTARKDVFAAKRLRKFFRIQEDAVCHKCMLRQSCKYVNQGVWNCGANNLNLAVVMQVITQYSLEAIPKQLVIPEGVKDSVSRILKEVLKLSPTVSRN